MTPDLTALRASHPEWLIRPTAAGRLFMATRRNHSHLTAEELGAGLAMTLVEDTFEALTEALTAQARIETPKC
ncbi:hypothetical protein EDD29_7866 [Actinocorallia herbida]|uniref:Uncharacterized protein n=1 Tax=Actinocorallia herbida TaxID=58109 RepID=A0A3N1D9J6_9ACTN|nr:hypothetical protein [Actinocorallia herbida]ROO90149.1 hypothetical protein EDD29_7866 [Actinocorallia herbida]